MEKVTPPVLTQWFWLMNVKMDRSVICIQTDSTHRLVVLVIILHLLQLDDIRRQMPLTRYSKWPRQKSFPGLASDSRRQVVRSECPPLLFSLHDSRLRSPLQSLSFPATLSSDFVGTVSAWFTNSSLVPQCPAHGRHVHKSLWSEWIKPTHRAAFEGAGERFSSLERQPFTQTQKEMQKIPWAQNDPPAGLPWLWPGSLHGFTSQHSYTSSPSSSC